MKTRLIVTAISLIGAVNFAFAQRGSHDDGLSESELETVRNLYQEAQEDQAVLEARKAWFQAMVEYQESVKRAMVEKDPKAEELLRKMRTFMHLEGLVHRREPDFLNDLDLPVQALDKSERKMWDAAMEQVKQQDFYRAFAHELKKEWENRDKHRRRQAAKFREYQQKARKAMININPLLQDIFQKLDRKKDRRRGDRDGSDRDRDDSDRGRDDSGRGRDRDKSDSPKEARSRSSKGEDDC